MEFVKFWKEYKRMCDNGDFPRCPFKSEIEGCWGCDEFMSNCPEKAERIVAQWVKEHPRMTNAQKFTEVFGEHRFTPDDVLRLTIRIPPENDTAEAFSTWLRKEYQPPCGT